MAVRAWILAVALIVTAALPARAQNTVTPDLAMRDAAQIAGEAMYYSSGAVGMVMAVVRGGDSISLGFGRLNHSKPVDPKNPKDPNLPKGNTIVRLGSISKVMTGQILAALSQPPWSTPLTFNHVASDYLPARIPPFPPGQTPGAWPREVMFIDLATHTAGMPRDIPVEECKPPLPPYCHFDRDHYTSWLKTFQLPYRPGTVANYSNAGFGLLGMAMEKFSGRLFSDLLKAHVSVPLKMADTIVVPPWTGMSEDLRGRFMVGYDEGRPVPAEWNGTDVMQPSGGVLSTADDMAKWLIHNLQASDGLGPTTALAQAIYVARPRLNAVIALDSPGRQLDGLGLGWEINFASGSRPMIIQKTGAFSGFMAYVAFAPGRDVGVFVALNKIDVPVLFSLMDQANNLIAGLATR